MSFFTPGHINNLAPAKGASKLLLSALLFTSAQACLAQSPSKQEVAAVENCRTSQARAILNHSETQARRLQLALGDEVAVPLSLRTVGWKLLGTAQGQRLAHKQIQWLGYNSDQVNAYSAGEATLVVSSALWQSGLSLSEQAAVLAHELAHITKGHVLLWECWSQKIKDPSLHETLRSEMEEEADRTARAWLQEAGLDGGALTTLRERWPQAGAPL